MNEEGDIKKYRCSYCCELKQYRKHYICDECKKYMHDMEQLRLANIKSSARATNLYFEREKSRDGLTNS